MRRLQINSNNLLLLLLVPLSRLKRYNTNTNDGSSQPTYAIKMYYCAVLA